MSAEALSRSREISKAVTDALGGRGLFGVELFVKGDMVWGFENALQSPLFSFKKKRNHCGAQ
jgi:formate-dependent phosphoribosylglycinamide formyltransferase (GAR transformylase)